MNRSIEEEQRNLENLRYQMESIKRAAALINQEKRSKIDSHDLAIRTGDIYMFADDFDDEETNPMPSLNGTEELRGIEQSSTTSAEVFEPDNAIHIDENVDKIIKKSKEFKNVCTRYLQKWFMQIHQQSKEHTYIIKLLSQERKYLRDAMSEIGSEMDSPATDSKE